MNISAKNYENSAEFTVSFRHVSGSSTPKTRTRREGSFGRRRGRGPQQFNGIHRRRKKKIRW